MTNPFSKPTGRTKRLKCFLWGNTGAGKTSLALNFPGTAVIDTEGGTDQYGDLYSFERLRCDDPQDMEKAIDWLRTSKHSFQTLVIDPITVYWESLQRDWQDKIHRIKRPNEELPYLQIGDWNFIKRDLRLFLRKLLRLDMNIVVTAREKSQYAEGTFTKIGTTFDGEKSLPYLFDCVLELQREKSTFRAIVHKDRGLYLPLERWEAPSPRVLYETIEGAYGKENLCADVEPVELVTRDTIENIQDSFNVLEMTQDQVTKGLGRYGADLIPDLSKDDAAKVLKNLKKKIVAKKKETDERFNAVETSNGKEA